MTSTAWTRLTPDAGPLLPRLATVSVVIPCFEYGRFLAEAVESALSQTGVEVDVVIVDDASTDDSLDVARRLAAADPRVNVLAHPSNRGPVATFNDGLRRATGEFVVRLDADDMLTPGALSRATSLALAHPSVGLVYGHPLHFTAAPPPPRTRARSWTVWPGRQWLADRCRDGCNVITSPEAVMRSSVVHEVGGQQPLDHTHDMEMWLRIAAFSDVGHVDGADQAWHRDHPASLSAREVDALTDLRERRDAFDVLFSGAAAALPEAAALHWLARRALARDALRQACHQYDRGTPSAQLVAALEAFAGEVEPPGAALPDWPALRRRRRVAASGGSRRPGLVVARGRRRVEHELRRRRWRRTGLYERPGAPAQVTALAERLARVERPA